AFNTHGWPKQRSSGTGDRKSQIPSSKAQTNSNSQLPNRREGFLGCCARLRFGICHLLGVWALEFGIFRRLAFAGNVLLVIPSEVEESLAIPLALAISSPLGIARKRGKIFSYAGSSYSLNDSARDCRRPRLSAYL